MTCARCGVETTELSLGLKICTLCNREAFATDTARLLVEQILEAASRDIDQTEPSVANLQRAIALGDVRRAAQKLTFDFKTVLRVDRPRAA